MEMAGNVKLIPSLRKSLRARAMDRCLPTLETSKNLTVNQEVGGSNPPAPVQSDGPVVRKHCRAVSRLRALPRSASHPSESSRRRGSLQLA